MGLKEYNLHLNLPLSLIEDWYSRTIIIRFWIMYKTADTAPSTHCFGILKVINAILNPMQETFIKSAAVIQKADTFLLVQEKAERAYGLWNLPSGKVEDGMTVEETAVKEAKEETGFDVNVERQLRVFTETFPDTKALHIFLNNRC